MTSTPSCCCQHHTTSVSQTLDELDFERGLWSSALNGEIERTQKLLKDGKDPNARDSSGYTALHYAARNGYTDVCRQLLSHGACVNAQTRAGLVTPLHRAASSGHECVVRLLLQSGADTQLQDSDGCTALHKACTKGSIQIARMLLNKETASVHVKDNREKLPRDYTSDISIHELLDST